MKTSLPAVAFAMLFVARPVWSQESPTEGNRATGFDLASGASHQQNDHALALALAQRASRLRMTPSLQFFLAQQFAALDRLLEALDTGRACAGPRPSVRSPTEALRACRELNTRLASRVGRLTVRAPSPLPPGLRVRVTGQLLAVPDLLGIAYPVLAGAIRVDAEAPGFTPFACELTVAAGSTREVVVELSPTAPQPPVIVAPGGSDVATVVLARPRPAPNPATGPSVGPWVTAGVGRGGARAGRRVLRAGRRGPERPGCSPVTRAGARQTRNTMTNATGTSPTPPTSRWASGVAAAVGSAVWFLVGRPHPNAGARQGVQWFITPTTRRASWGRTRVLTDLPLPRRVGCLPEMGRVFPR